MVTRLETSWRVGAENSTQCQTEFFVGQRRSLVRWFTKFGTEERTGGQQERLHDTAQCVCPAVDIRFAGELGLEQLERMVPFPPGRLPMQYAPREDQIDIGPLAIGVWIVVFKNARQGYRDERAGGRAGIAPAVREKRRGLRKVQKQEAQRAFIHRKIIDVRRIGRADG